MALGGCGGDEEDKRTERAATTPAPARTQTDTAPALTTGVGTADSPPADSGEETRTESPEDQPGGAGDEVPARSQALFTGRGGRIGPRIVLVPPFIAVRVELRSADGGRYSLSGGGRTLKADPEVTSASTTFGGLRPGRRIVFRGTGGRVVVEASAEPGP